MLRSYKIKYRHMLLIAKPCLLIHMDTGSVIDEDTTLVQETHAHLQSISKFVWAMDLVEFMNTPEMWEHVHMEKSISLATAQLWMKKLDYHWSYTPKGQ